MFNTNENNNMHASLMLLGDYEKDPPKDKTGHYKKVLNGMTFMVMPGVPVWKLKRSELMSVDTTRIVDDGSLQLNPGHIQHVHTSMARSIGAGTTAEGSRLGIGSAVATPADAAEAVGSADAFGFIVPDLTEDVAVEDTIAVTTPTKKGQSKAKGKSKAAATPKTKASTPKTPTLPKGTPAEGKSTAGRPKRDVVQTVKEFLELVQTAGKTDVRTYGEGWTAHKRWIDRLCKDFDKYLELLTNMDEFARLQPDFKRLGRAAEVLKVYNDAGESMASFASCMDGALQFLNMEPVTPSPLPPWMFQLRQRAAPDKGGQGFLGNAAH